MSAANCRAAVPGWYESARQGRPTGDREVLQVATNNSDVWKLRLKTVHLTLHFYKWHIFIAHLFYVFMLLA